MLVRHVAAVGLRPRRHRAWVCGAARNSGARTMCCDVQCCTLSWYQASATFETVRGEHLWLPFGIGFRSVPCTRARCPPTPHCAVLTLPFCTPCAAVRGCGSLTLCRSSVAVLPGSALPLLSNARNVPCSAGATSACPMMSPAPRLQDEFRAAIRDSLVRVARPPRHNTPHS